MYGEENFLAHHGIKGQKWGVRRYQNQDGSLTSEGRRRRGLSDQSSFKKLTSAVKNARTERKNKKAAKEKEEEAQKHENLKNFVRKHPKQLYKHRTSFSSDEIKKLVEDIKSDKALKDIRDAEIKRGWEKVQNLADSLTKVKNLATVSKDLWNLAAEVNNSLIDNGKKQGKKLTKIGSSPEKPKEDRSAIDAWLKKASAQDVYDRRSSLTVNELNEWLKRQSVEEKVKNKIPKP